MIAGAASRRVALAALVRVDAGGAYANLVLPPLLARSGLTTADRALATELVYGATRMRRACDWAVVRFLSAERAVADLEPVVRNALRLGAYQLLFLRTPPHAAVSSTVSLVPERARGLVNAVLRRLAEAPEPAWPNRATELSYPDWIVARLEADLGTEAADAALEQMNRPSAVQRRADGYVQDRSSQWVAELVGVQPGERVLDVCAGPGGKATGMAVREALVVALDVNAGRAGLVQQNAARFATGRVVSIQADGCRPPFRPDQLGSTAGFDRVLVDAPCSGLGVLRRRPDARWRVQESDVAVLAALQRELLGAAAGLVRPGGTLVYSVCTLTDAETVAVDAWLGAAHPELLTLGPPPDPWVPAGRGARLVPQAAGTDGMFVLRCRRRGPDR